MLKNLFAITLVLGIFQASLCVDFCKTQCRNGDKNIACGNDGKLKAKCSADAKVVPITKELRDQFVNKHNELRNKFAQGFDKFSPAVRMATVQWSDELAKLAEFNVKKCDFKHDVCFSSPSFNPFGQNLAVKRWKGMDFSVGDVVGDAMQNWFNEYSLAPVSSLNKYPKGSKGIGHFVAIVQETSTHVGCAVLRQTLANGFIEQLTTCNYAAPNMVDRPVYTAGKVAAQCKSGTNPSYKNLCSVKETYN